METKKVVRYKETQQRPSVYEFHCAECEALCRQTVPVQRCACGVLNDIREYMDPSR